MFRRGLVLSLVLGVASVANAGAVLDITALTPPDVGSNYSGGSTVQFQVAMSQDSGADIQARLITLDFGASDPALSFVGDFAFDFSTLIADALYSKFPGYPKPNVTYTGTAPTPGFILVLPGDGSSLVVGTGQVTLPAEGADKMSYKLDALNAGGGTVNDSARLDFDFANPTTWLANGMGSDLITGGTLDLSVAPEPATLVLLGLGGLAAIRRRRRSA